MEAEEGIEPSNEPKSLMVSLIGYFASLVAVLSSSDVGSFVARRAVIKWNSIKLEDRGKYRLARPGCWHRS